MFRNVTPAVRALLIANIGIYLLQQYFVGFDVRPYELWPWTPEPDPSVFPFEPWQLVTYAFLHGSYGHLLANMFALLIFGPDVERLFGTSYFIVYYFVCAITAAVAQMIVTALVPDAFGPTIGASGAIFGILLAYGMAFPRRQLLFLFLIPIRAWLFVTLYGLFELGMGVFGYEQGVAHFAHIGGMVGGYLLIRYWRARHRTPT
ncbi:MAG: rhomboid family intramembrane serine protease [Steroidobacteraceae bacterium]|jgi:membrane associated rhomboid family serine protease